MIDHLCMCVLRSTYCILSYVATRKNMFLQVLPSLGIITLIIIIIVIIIINIKRYEGTQ
jgi:hypothetical protein